MGTKTAIVTGATKGIGKATALMLASRGYWVVAVGRNKTEGAALEKELAAASGGEFLAADLASAGAAEQITDLAMATTGRIDVVVNNAGINLPGGVADVTADTLDAVFATNLRAAVLLSGAAVRHMKAQGSGVIINVSSEAGVVGFPGQVAYNVSKGGLGMLTKSIVADCAQDGIRAVTVSPGTTATPLVEKLISDAADSAAMAAALEDRPAARLGRPEEIAEVICFASSDAAEYLTGSEIIADGGRTSVG